LGGHAIHAVCGRADEDLLATGDAEGANEGIDGFVRADADEEVVWGEGFGGVGVGVAEVAELLLELYLVATLILLVGQRGIRMMLFVRVWVSV
jgi:hypothetical protein